jgi:hypothetical protein
LSEDMLDISYMPIESSGYDDDDGGGDDGGDA